MAKGIKLQYAGNTIEINGDLELVINGEVQDKVRALFGIPFLSSSTMLGTLTNGAEVVCTSYQRIAGEYIEVFVDQKQIYAGKLTIV